MDVLLAKKFVFDKSNAIIGHEVSFYIPESKIYKANLVTPQVIINSLAQKIQALTKNKMLFLRFNDTLLLDTLPYKFDKENVVIIPPENFKASNFLFECFVDLQKSGYSVMLDDFLINAQLEPFVEYANIFRINVHHNKMADIKSLYAPLLNKPIYYFASHINSFEEYMMEQKNDFSFFQGEFFLRPSMLNSEKFSFLQFLSLTYKASEDINELITVMKVYPFLKDVFLDFANSPFINNNKGKWLTINHAASFLGNIEMTRWLFILSLRYVAYTKSKEVFLSTLARARFCELISTKVGGIKSNFNFFLAGIFSALDALLDIPINHIVSDLPISETVKEIIYSDYLINDVYEMAVAYERGEWPTVMCYLANLNISYKDLLTHYQEAAQWAEDYILCLEPLEKKYKHDNKVIF